MAFDTTDERSAMVNMLGLPVPVAIPDAAAGFTAKMAAMFLFMFPVDGLAPPVASTVSGASAQQPLPRLMILGVFPR